MPSFRLYGILLALPAGVMAGGSARSARGAPAGAPGTSEVVVLRAARPSYHRLDVGTVWRYHETWRSDVARLESGEPVAVDIFNTRQRVARGGSGGSKVRWQVRRAKRLLGSPFPPAGWRETDFDDTLWLRHPGPLACQYRSLALICLRGKFQAPDPSRVEKLSLSVRFQGGAVAYLNGTEVGRAFLPAGKLRSDTLAEDYPEQAYVDSKGKLIRQPTLWYGRTVGSSEENLLRRPFKVEDTRARYRTRGRKLDVSVPAALLRKGLNVLAVEVHRSPARPVMFTAEDMKHGYSHGANPHILQSWNRCSAEDVKLAARCRPGAVVANIRRPQGLQVWTESVLAAIDPVRFGDLAEPVRPIFMRGLRNGAYSGQVVVGAAGPIPGLKASITALRGPRGGAIPASAMELAYAGVISDALAPSPPAEVKPLTSLFGRTLRFQSAEARDAMGVLHRIWLVVKVPRDAAPGTYAGTLTVRADGAKPVGVPVRLKVVGEWVLPDPREFTTFFGVHESPNTVAVQYKVPLWSEAHWRHLDRVYELLGQIGTKDIYLPLITRTHLANGQSMVRWIKEPGGAWRHDYSVAERYLDLALKHLGKVPVVCLYLHDYGFRMGQAGREPKPPAVTVLDPATGQTRELPTPPWGTPEARAFWAPVIRGMRAMLARRGLEKSMMFGMGTNNWAKPGCWEDLRALAPEVLWANRTHYLVAKVGHARKGQPIGYHAVVGGAVGVFWDPDDDQPHYGWRSPALVIAFPRYGNNPGAVLRSCLSTYRLCGEGTLLSGLRLERKASAPYSSWARRGMGHIGADFWPIVDDPVSRRKKPLCDRDVFWHSLSLSAVPSILAPGAAGPIPTCRHQMIREAAQEAEARVFVQEALLDEARRDRLGADLARRCKELCDGRTRALRYYSGFCYTLNFDDFGRVFNQYQWEDGSERLYELAGEVSKALGRK